MAATLQQSLDFYGYHHLMGNITGNQDLPRFASRWPVAVCHLPKMRARLGPKRNSGQRYCLYKVAEMIAFIGTIPGVPVIYYGDEIGMPGAGDPDNRRMMRFDNLSERKPA